MPTSLQVRQFIGSIPSSGLYVHLLWDLGKSAGNLAGLEPDLVIPFSLIRDAFFSLADRWENNGPLSPSVSNDVTPRVASAIEDALKNPAIDSFAELARTLNWARKYPLASGIGES